MAYGLLWKHSGGFNGGEFHKVNPRGEMSRGYTVAKVGVNGASFSVRAFLLWDKENSYSTGEVFGIVSTNVITQTYPYTVAAQAVLLEDDGSFGIVTRKFRTAFGARTLPEGAPFPTGRYWRPTSGRVVHVREGSEPGVICTLEMGIPEGVVDLHVVVEDATVMFRLGKRPMAGGVSKSGPLFYTSQGG